jgi:hypothetical protein
MKTFLVSFFLILGAVGSVQAKDLRVLEVTDDSRKLRATVEFLETKTSDMILKAQSTGNKSFDWLDIPDGAKAARIKVGELATLPFDLAESGTTLVELGSPAIAQNAKGVSQAILAATVRTDRSSAKEGSQGWVFLGRLNMQKSGGAGVQDSLTWSSLYLVLPPKLPLDANNLGTKKLVENLAKGKRLRADFPLILRKIDAQGKIERSKDDQVIRAGQYVLVSGFREPDEQGNVYAEVTVLAPPTGR